METLINLFDLQLVISNCIENLYKYHNDYNTYGNEQTIPEWNKYKHHSFKLILSTRPDTVTDKQLLIFCNDVGYYNDNNNHGGSIGVRIKDNGHIEIGGEYPKLHVKITEIFMFN